MNPVFIDTNILVYAVDKDAGSKHEKAKVILRPFFTEDIYPAISTQVLHEFASCLYRWKFSDEKVSTLVAPLRYWNIISNDWTLFNSGLAIKKRFQTSFWDGLIIAAAIASGAKEIWSEDFNSGQDYDGVTAVNPFEK